MIEEIVGQISDEFDVDKPEVLKVEDGVYEVSGGMLIEDLEDELGIELSDRDEDTIGGVVLSELGRAPAVGDTVEVGPVAMEILNVQFNRINTLRLTVRQPAAVSSEDEP